MLCLHRTEDFGRPATVPARDSEDETELGTVAATLTKPHLSPP